MPYQHGIYGQQVPTTDALAPAGVATLPVYIGTAPVDDLDTPAAAVNTPLLLTSFEDAEAKIGYSDDWATYTLCEAVYAHFKNRIQPIGPIVVVNVYDPATHTEGADEVAATDIIGSKVNGVRKGLAVVELIYQTHNMIPTLLAAPGWSSTKTVKEAMMTAAKAINGHWDAFVLADLDSATSKTITSAISWKSTNGYSDVGLKVGWPQAEIAGKRFRASTLMAVRMQQTDFAAGNVPYISPSNKQVDMTKTVLEDGSSIIFDEQDANELNKKGITTFNFRSGIWVLWGPHGANFEYGAQIDPKEVFDASIRMMQYLTNSFQQRYMASIDGPLNRSVVDTILNDAGTWLNSLVADGKLLFAEIRFNESSNPTSSIVEGDFIFDIAPTTTPVAKSLTFRVQYTTRGISTLFGGESA